MDIPERLKQIKILVVDDDETIREMCRAGLEVNGFTNIWEAIDGKNALMKLHDINFDIIICDWTMPGMSGLDLLKRVRQEEKLKHIAFLMATSMSDKENVAMAIAAGVSDYVTKPFDPDGLCNKVVTAYARNLNLINKAAST